MIFQLYCYDEYGVVLHIQCHFQHKFSKIKTMFTSLRTWQIRVWCDVIYRFQWVVQAGNKQNYNRCPFKYITPQNGLITRNGYNNY